MCDRYYPVNKKYIYCVNWKVALFLRNLRDWSFAGIRREKFFYHTLVTTKTAAAEWPQAYLSYWVCVGGLSYGVKRPQSCDPCILSSPHCWMVFLKEQTRNPRLHFHFFSCHRSESSKRLYLVGSGRKVDIDTHKSPWNIGNTGLKY